MHALPSDFASIGGAYLVTLLGSLIAIPKKVFDHQMPEENQGPAPRETTDNLLGSHHQIVIIRVAKTKRCDFCEDKSKGLGEELGDSKNTITTCGISCGRPLA